MGKLLELAERVESATGADREIDTDTYEALGFDVDRNAKIGRSSMTTPRAIIFGHWANVPQITASLDAVLVLVAEKLPSCHRGVTEYIDGECRADIWNDDFAAEATCRTMPLALLAAFLRALDATHPTAPQPTEPA